MDPSEELSLLLPELSITAELFVSAMEPLIQGIQGGRSPQTLGLEEALEEPGEYLQSLQEIHDEARAFLKKIPASDLNQHLEIELNFWENFLQTAHPLLKKLKLLAEQSQITGLGKMPIEDAWQEIRQMAGRS